MFINPGNPIRYEHLERFADTVDLYMTHGYELSVPYATGVMRWNLAGDHPELPLVYNSPAPDFYWLYDGRGYSDQEAVDTQAAILAWYRQTVGRGVLYNHMWHDYAIEEGEMTAPDRLELFDLHADFVSTEPVYLPTIPELEAKLRLAKHVQRNTVWGVDSVDVLLDLSSVGGPDALQIAGMGLRIGQIGHDVITTVVVDGQTHGAFTDDVVTLPAPVTALMNVHVELGTTADRTSRVTYSSKQLRSAQLTGDGLELSLANPSATTRLCLEIVDSTPVIVGARTVYPPNGNVCLTLNAPPVPDVDIQIDGDLSEWAGVPVAATDPLEGASDVDMVEVALAHDADYLYGKLTLDPPADFFGSFKNNIYIDADNDVGTGWPVSGIGSELVIQAGNAYAQTGLSYNDGPVDGSPTSWSPAGVASEVEFRISRTSLLQGSATRVFSGDEPIRLVFEALNEDWSLGDHAPDSGGLIYTFGLPPPPPPIIEIDGDFLDWGAAPDVQTSTDPVGDALGAHADITAIEAVTDQDYLYLFLQFAASTDFFSTSQNNLYLDLDNDPLTGHASYGTEVLIQAAAAYSQLTGGWNEGAMIGQAITYAADGTGTQLELRIDLAMTHPGGEPAFPVGCFSVRADSQDAGWVTQEIAPDVAGLQVPVAAGASCP